MLFKSERPYYQKLIESEFERALAELKMTPLSDSKEYETILSNAERLHKMMAIEKPSSVSKEAVLNAGTNLVGILMIIKHEWLNPINSKALSFVSRVR